MNKFWYVDMTREMLVTNPLHPISTYSSTSIYNPEASSFAIVLLGDAPLSSVAADGDEGLLVTSFAWLSVTLPGDDDLSSDSP